MQYNLIIRNGKIYDGRGTEPITDDIAIQDDKIAAIGDLGQAVGKREIDAQGLAVAPGFINMLSWAVESLIVNGRSQSDIRQGVTLEVMGEGFSYGPLSEAMKADFDHGMLGNPDLHYEIEWTTLGEYLEFLVRKGVSCNVASYVGSSTLRIHAVGYDDRPPTQVELAKMQQLTREAMAEGAVGLSAALIYPPASFATTDELISLVKVMAEYDGVYVSHIRSEGEDFMGALDEFIHIVEETGVRGEVYHLKAAGFRHWDKLETAVAKIEAAQQRGLPITADMYTYNASGTGLDSVIPAWARDGGTQAMLTRLRDPEIRTRIKQDMNQPSSEWENMWYEARSTDDIIPSGFATEALKPLTGKTLTEISKLRGTSPEDTVIDLLLEDGGNIFTIYKSMSEENIRHKIQLPWVSFCSDAESMAPEGKFLKNNPHPRAYGSFARVLGKYCRDERLITLEEAIRRLTGFPASVLKLDRRGLLEPGYFADVVIFDPDKVQDHATIAQPQQYATGMIHVFVNGRHVLKNGEHTGATPGRVVRGPGWKKQA